MNEKILIEYIEKFQLFRRMAIKEKIKNNLIMPEQFPIMFFIHLNKEVTQKEIADHLIVTPASIALSTKRLEQNGLIKKIKDENNKRCNKICLTLQGEKEIKKLIKVFDDADKLSFKGITNNEKKIFLNVYDKMIFNISGQTHDEIKNCDVFELKKRMKQYSNSKKKG